MALLPCGHHPGCMYRYREYPGNKTRKFCMACVLEKFPEADIDNMLTITPVEQDTENKLMAEDAVIIPEPESITVEEPEPEPIDPFVNNRKDEEVIEPGHDIEETVDTEETSDAEETNNTEETSRFE